MIISVYSVYFEFFLCYYISKKPYIWYYNIRVVAAFYYFSRLKIFVNLLVKHTGWAWTFSRRHVASKKVSCNATWDCWEAWMHGSPHDWVTSHQFKYLRSYFPYLPSKTFVTNLNRKPVRLVPVYKWRLYIGKCIYFFLGNPYFLGNFEGS